MSSILTTLFLLVAATFGDPPTVNDERPRSDHVFAVKAAKVFTAGERGVIDRGIVVVRDGKIIAVGKEGEVKLPQQTEIIDLGELWLAPGLHEPHCHIAGDLWNLNDPVYLTNPDLETLHVVEPNNPNLKDGLAGGVTSGLLIPGSAVNMSGFGTIVKFAGDTVDEMLVRFPGSLKIAQAGNPEWYSFGVGRAMMNWNTRDTMQRGLAWAEQREAGGEWDPYWSNFEGLHDRSVPISVHTQIFQVVMTTLTMLKGELGMEPFIDHGTFDGFRNAELAAKLKVPVMNGPRQFWFDRSRSKFLGCGAEWSKAEGIILGYNTDSPVIPQEELSFQAAMAVRYGHDDAAAALEGITSNAAFALKIDDLSGKLEPGLDADFVAWTGFPLDPRSWVVRTWIRGKVVYEAEDGRRF